MKTNLRLEDLTIEQKLGMVFCARSYTQEDDKEFILEMVRNRALGCIQAPAGDPAFMQKVLDAADYPIINIMDMEMGYPGSDLPPIPQMALAACNKPEYYRAYARGVVRDAKAAGLNGSWSPVLDVPGSTNPLGIFRKFSDDPNRIAFAAEEICKVFADNNFIACGKHYPSGQDAGVDTHMANIGSYVTKEELINKRLMPYKYLMDKGLLPSIMSGHWVHWNIDPEYPASLSRKTIGIIREMGFDGVIFTDSFAMMAILQKYGEENVLGMAIDAGNDVVLPNYRSTTRKSFEYLCKNYRDGLFSEERLNEAVSRVLKLQELVNKEVTKVNVFTEEDRKIYDSIARDCITAVTDEGVSAELDPNNKDRVFVVLTPAKQMDGNVRREAITRNWYEPDRIAEKIKTEFPEAEVVFLSEFPMGKENQDALVAVTRHKEVVFVSYCNYTPYQGADGLSRRVEALINAFNYSGKLAAILHFGNPFALQPLNHIPRKLFGYMMPQSQEYAFEVLSGKIPAKGSLPFNVKFQ